MLALSQEERALSNRARLTRVSRASDGNNGKAYGRSTITSHSIHRIRLAACDAYASLTRWLQKALLQSRRQIDDSKAQLLMLADNNL